MSFHSWLQNLRSALAPCRGQRKHQRRGSLRAATHRPSLEVLEDRLTPSFIWGGSFPDGGSYPGPVVTDHSAAVGDFTSDGIRDQVTNGLNGELYLQAGLGDGTFAAPIRTGAPPTVGSLAAADFNGDGRLDVVTFGASGGTEDAAASALVLLGRGDGTFVWPFHYYATSVSPATGIDTWDFNGDGRPDLEVAGYDFWDGSPVTGVLVNDGDWPSVVPYLRINDATVTEGNTGTVAATFTVTQPSGSTETITVDYATANGTATATAGSDYQAASGTLTFAPGETSKTITVLVNGDRLPEPNESFYVSLSNPTNADIFDGAGLGTIVDDERGISITPSMSRSEGNTGQTPFAFAVALSSASDAPVTVNWATADKTATAGSDYQAASGTLTFAPGETSKTVNVLVNGDRLPEPSESFVVNLSSPTNAVIANGQSVGTIMDDEPRISISDVTKKEGRNGTTTLFTFTVTLSAVYDQAVTMSYRTVDGTATTSDGDYVAKTGTLTFAPGETTKTITIEVKGDSKKEANETFYLDLFGNSGNSLFTKNRGIGTILNDD